MRVFLLVLLSLLFFPPVFSDEKEDRVGLLLRKLTVDDYIVRCAALNALFGLNDERILPAVRKVFKTATDDDIRFWCACVMLKYGDEEAKKFLLKGLRSESERHRYHAVAAFGRAKDRSALDELRDAFKHETVPQVQTVAAYALANLGFEEGYRFLKDRVKDGNWLAQDMAAVLLGWLGRDDAKPLLRELFESIGADDKERRSVKICAAWGLAHYGDAEAMRYLVEAGNESLTAQVGVCEVGKPMIPVLVDILKKSSSAAARRSAAVLLGVLGGAEVVKPLADALKRTTAAAVGLSYTMHPKAVPPLASVATDPNANKVLRRNAIKALGTLGFNEAVPPLKKVLAGAAFKKDEAGSRSALRLREYAAVALGEIGSDAAVKALTDVLTNEKNTSVRRSICWVVRKNRLTAAASAVLQLLKENNESLRRAAHDTLKALTGKDYGTDYKAWKEFLEKQNRTGK